MSTSTGIRLFGLPLILAWLLMALSSGASAASCKSEIRRNNILGNALFTTLFRGVNGELNSWADLGESLSYGAAGGYLFYASREMIGEGDESRGLAMAYLASSVTENTTYGDHPLAHLRYGVGPLEIKWSTPFARRSEPRLSFALNSFDTVGALALALSGKANNFSLRNGVLRAEDQGFTRDEHSASALGRTVVVKEESQGDQALWHHELIHTTQYLQFSSFGADGLGLLDFGATNQDSKSQDNFSLRIEWFNSLVNAVDDSRDYEDRWMEIEARQFAQSSSSSQRDGGCAAQVGFQFHF